MNLNLTNIKTFLIERRVLIIFGVLGLVFLGIIIVQLLQPEPEKQPIIPPLPVSQQPVKNGKFDETAPISQKSKSAIEKLAPRLPFRRTVTTSTGTKVTFAVFTRPRETHTLYVEMFPVNFQSTYGDLALPKNVLDFRQTAAVILNWITDQNVSPAEIFISWGSKAYIQKSAAVWLVESPQFPKVVKKDNQFRFETEPVKSQ